MSTLKKLKKEIKVRAKLGLGKSQAVNKNIMGHYKHVVKAERDAK